MVFFVPRGVSGKTDKALGEGSDAGVSRGIRKADFDHVISHFGPDAHQHLNNASNQFNVDLVDADQGDPMYNEGVSEDGVTEATVIGTSAMRHIMFSGSGTPGVVTIDQLSQRAGFIETGPFDVRIILTEEPKGGLTTDMILVEGGGSATAVTRGVTLRGALLEILDAPDVVQAVRDSELTTAIATYYNVDTTATAPVPCRSGRVQSCHASRSDRSGQYVLSVLCHDCAGSGGQW